MGPGRGFAVPPPPLSAEKESERKRTFELIELLELIELIELIELFFRPSFALKKQRNLDDHFSEEAEPTEKYNQNTSPPKLNIQFQSAPHAGQTLVHICIYLFPPSKNKKKRPGGPIPTLA